MKVPTPTLGMRKGDSRLNWLLRIGAGLALALGLAATAVAATPDGKTAATALTLSTSTPASGSLVGSGAGSFAYYTFNYPGDGSIGTLTLTVSPTDTATLNAVGVNVFQNGNQITQATALGSTPGTNAVTFSSTTPGPILVQVYNYNPGVNASYRLSLSDVNTTPSATPVATVTPRAIATPTSGGTATNPATLSTSASGTLAGNTAGNFTYYTFSIPGDGSTQTLTLNFSPGGIDVGNALVLSVFQNGTTLVTANGGQASAPGQLSVSFSSTTAGPVLVQIGNYNPSPTISYTISR